MRALVACSLAALVGCDTVFDLHGRDRSDASAASLCFGRYGANHAGLFDHYLAAAPTMDVIAPPSLATGTPGDCTEVVAQQDAAQTEVCVIAGRNISIAAGTTVHGERPIVFIATGDLIVTGTLSVSSHRDQPDGAGASFSTCAAPLTGGTAASTDGGGGGAGGSFATIGGNGGQGAGNPLGGSALRDSSPLGFVRGGCAGGNGGDAAGTSGGTRGSSAGALYLLAGSSITIAGTLDASGAAGGGGGKGVQAAGGGGAGGGGGGSGGLIALDAPMIRLAATARLVANGGGGGGGGGSYGTVPGLAGTEADPASAFPFVAPGGVQGGLGGGGGNGTNAIDSSGNGQNASGSGGGGGGGGGGGAGYIKLYTTSQVDEGAQSSPAYGN